MSRSQAVDVDPYDLYVSAEIFAHGADRLNSIATALSNTLENCAGMAGDDQGGREFGTNYDAAAAAMLGTVRAAIPVVSSMGAGLVAMANNYLKAEHHSTAGASGEPEQYPPLGLDLALTLPDPPSAVGHGSSPLPGPLARYWANGHQDRLRAAASAYRKATADIETLGQDLANAVQAITDNNSSASIDAMAAFFAQVWQAGPDSPAPLTAAIQGGEQLGRLCEGYAQALDAQHSQVESKLAEAGAQIGAISLLGGLLSEVSFGSSDDLAANLDLSAAEATLGGTIRAFMASISLLLDSGFWDSLTTLLTRAAGDAATVEPTTAETTQVAATLDNEMAATEARDSTTFAKSIEPQLSRLSLVEQSVVARAAEIYKSPQFGLVRAARAASRSVEIKVGETTVIYEPDLPSSGFTLFPDAFVVGPEAFASEDELTKTLLQETYRLQTSAAADGVTSDLVHDETEAAASFANRCYTYLRSR